MNMRRLYQPIGPASPRLRPSILSVSLGYIAWAILFWSLDWIQERRISSWRALLRENAPPLERLLIFAAAVAFAFFVFPFLYALVRRWRARRRIVVADLFIGSLATFFVVSAISSPLSPALLTVTGISLLAFALRLAPPRRAKIEIPSRPSFFDEVLGGSGLAPLEDFSKDELERGPLLQSLLELVGQKRPVSPNFGLEGALGSGKTSLLLALRSELKSKGHQVIWFSAWNYREPDRLIRAYFDEIEGTLGRVLALPTLKRRLYRLGAGLSELGGSKVFSLLGGFLGRLSEGSVERLRRELKDALSELNRPLVILLDDLDRLDAAEVQAVLRAIRLVGDLPNLAHVFAYDREQLSRALFPDDEQGTLSRDYLAKIIHTELSIGSPPAELALRLLNGALGPLLERVGAQTAKSFVNRIRQEPISYITDVLPTPREVRRVAAATAWLWERMEGSLNLFDLFILSIIHYRFPRLYSSMRAHPEWFTVVEWWADNPWLMLLKETWEKESKDFFDGLAVDNTPEGRRQLRLLRILLPSIAETGIGSPRPAERDARRERRFLHPQIYSRYFHLYVPATSVTEKEIESFAEEVGNLPEGKGRQQFVSGRIRQAAEKGRIESFWTQWDLPFGLESKIEKTLARDLAMGIALAANNLDDEEGFLRTSDRQVGTFKVVRLIECMGDDQEATELLREVIENSTSIEFAASLVAYAKTKEERKDSTYYGDLTPNWKALAAVLSDLIRHSYVDTDRSLLSAPRGDLGAAVLLAGDRAMVVEAINRELKRTPEFLPQLLKLAAPRRIGVSREEEVVIEDFDPNKLKDLLPMGDIYDLTKEIPLEKWADPVERELVGLFRKWISKELGLR
jgi:KAP-like P-loop domain-containing protein